MNPSYFRFYSALIRKLAMALPFGLSLAVQAQFIFATNNGALTITGYTGTGSSVVIPAMTNGYPVTAIGPQAFLDADFTSITIPGGITTIGSYAFYACLYVPTINLPTSVTNISGDAFNFCYGLTNFSMDPANPAYTSSGGVLFDKNQQVLVQFPENSAAITYAIPNTVTSIGDTSFTSCHNLHGVTIPTSVTNIGVQAFLGCIYFSDIIIPASVLNIEDFAFTACSQMTNMSIGSNVANIGIDAFDNCSSLAYPIVIPDSVRNIGSNAFVDCGALPAITIGSGVTNIGVSAFEFCSSLASITVSASNAFYASSNGVLFDKSQLTLIQFPTGATAEYVVPDSVTSIEGYAFDGATKLFSIAFDAALTNIGEYAFDGCYELPDVTIPANVATIGGEAFEGCGSVRTLSLDNNLTSIGDGAFYGCINLLTVSLSAAVTNIGLQAFDDCSSLTNIAVASANPIYASSNGILFNKALTSLLQFPDGVYGSYTIPLNVTAIGSYSFDTCGLSSVAILDSVTNIGNFAFYDDAFTNLALPDSISNIGEEAFARSSLVTLVVPNSVVSIGEDAFENSASLTNVIIGSGVTNLGDDAFYGCDALISAYFEGDAPSNNGTAFFEDSQTTVYYQPGTSGWTSTYGGVPAMLNPASQITLQLQAAGFVSNQFVMNLVGPSNAVVAIQAAANLTNPVWISIGTNTLSSNGAGTFQDTQSTNFPRRFYRLLSW